MSDRRELDELIIAYLVDDIAEEQCAELEARLRREESARQRFARLCEQEVALRDVAAAQMIAAEESSALGAPAPATPARPRSRRWGYALATLSAAAALLIVGGYFYRQNALETERLRKARELVAARERETRQIAAARKALSPRITEAGGKSELVAAEGAAPTKEGARVRPGDQLKAAAGERVMLRYEDGTSIELKGGSALRLAPSGDPRTAGKSLELQKGEISCTVAKQPAGRPMTIATPDAEVTVIGTVFTLSAWPKGSCLRVKSGSVRLTRKGVGDSVEVTAGRHVVLRKGKPLAVRDSKISLEDYRTHGGGSWKVTRAGGETLVTQEKVNAGLSVMLLGHPHLKKGVVSGQFRLLMVEDIKKAAVGYTLHYPPEDQVLDLAKSKGAGDVLLSRGFKYGDVGAWWNFNHRFELRADNSIVLEQLRWRDGEPVPLARKKYVYSTPKDIQRTLASLGLGCVGAKVEFRRLRLTDETDPAGNIEKRLWTRIQAAPSGLNLDFEDCRYTGKGKWVVEKTKAGPVIRQLDPKAGSGVLFLGRPKYRKGLLFGQVMQLKAGSPKAGAREGQRRPVPFLRTRIDFSRWENYGKTPSWVASFLHYPGRGKWPTTFDYFCFWKPRPKDGYDVWLNYIISFELADDSLVLYGAAWNPGMPMPTRWAKTRRSPKPGKWILSRPACNIGVGSKGTVTYWRNLKLLDAVEAKKPKIELPEAF